MRAHFQLRECLQTKIICFNPLKFVYVEPHRILYLSVQNAFLRKAERVNYCTFLSGYVHTASWLLSLDTQKKRFFILHSSLRDHIPNSLDSLLAFSNLENVTEHQLELGPRIKPSEIPTWYHFQATVATAVHPGKTLLLLISSSLYSAACCQPAPVGSIVCAAVLTTASAVILPQLHQEEMTAT